MKTNKFVCFVTAIALTFLGSGVYEPLADTQSVKRKSEYNIPTIISEDPIIHGEFERHFFLSDGNALAVSYPYQLYVNDNGTFREIDNTLHYEGDVVKNNSNNYFNVSFSTDSSTRQTVSISYDNRVLYWTPTVCIEGKEQSVSKNSSIDIAEITPKDRALDNNEKWIYSNKSQSKIIYKNAFDDNGVIDLVYNINSNEIEESLVINEKTDFSSYGIAFPDNINLEPYYDKSNGIVFLKDNTDKTIFIIEKACMFDKNGSELFDIDVTVERADGQYTIKYTPNKAWIDSEDRVYPLVFDPTITNPNSTSNYQDTYVHSGDSAGAHNNETTMVIGRKNSISNRTYLKIDLPNIPSNSSIVSANLKTFFNSSGTTSAGTVNIYRVLGSWSESTITYNNQPTSTLLQSDAPCGFGSNGGIEFNVLSAIRGFNQGSFSNYGFMIRYSDETYNDYNVLCSSNNSTSSKRPILTIAYTLNNEVESNDSPSNANILSLSEKPGAESTTYGKLSSVNDVDYYQFTPQRHGRLFVFVYFPSGYQYNAEFTKSVSDGWTLNTTSTNTYIRFSFVANKPSSLPTYTLKIYTMGSSVSSSNYTIKIFYANYGVLDWDYPTDTTRTYISSPVGYRTYDGQYHKGIDIPGSTSNGIYSVCTGEIIGSGYDSSMGNYVKVRSTQTDPYTGQSLVIRYMHLDSINISYLVDTNGDGHKNVTKGNIIGYMGKTGNAKAVHLHIDVNDLDIEGSLNNIFALVNPIDLFENKVTFSGNVYHH